VQIVEGWGQGLCHNISSCLHSLEQIYRKKLFLDYLINKYESANFYLNPLSNEDELARLKYRNHIEFLKRGGWFQLEHSDDKHEITQIHKDDIWHFIKFTSLVPRLFSLTTSSTKDSYSRIVSEFVSLINIKGNSFDNAYKTIAKIMDVIDDDSFPNVYIYN
jgi:hypothetical protein